MSKTDLVLSNAFTPVFDADSIKQGLEAYNKAITTILTKDDVVKMADNTFIRKSGWNKLSLFFGISTDTIRSSRVEHGDGSYSWTVVVTAYKKDYKVTRSATCHSIEKDFMDGKNNETRKDADVYAMAETRAVGRACSAFFGTGDVSYEEIIGSSPEDIHRQTSSVYCTCTPEERQPSKNLMTEQKFQDSLKCEGCNLPISSLVSSSIIEKRSSTS